MATGLWSDYASSSLSGSGTSASPYLISSGADFAKMSALVNSGSSTYRSKYWKLTTNIDLSAHYWVPIGNGNSTSTNYYFRGNFDGCGYTITGLDVNSGQYSCYSMGLFGLVYSASDRYSYSYIGNICLNSCSTYAQRSDGVAEAGVLVGTAHNLMIENIHTFAGTGGNTLISAFPSSTAGITAGIICGYADDVRFKDIFLEGGNIIDYFTDHKSTSPSYYGGIVGKYENGRYWNDASDITISFKSINIYDLRVDVYDSNIYVGMLCGSYTGGSVASGSYHTCIEDIFINDGYLSYNGASSQRMGGVFGYLNTTSATSAPYIRNIRINVGLGTKALGTSSTMNTFVGVLGTSSIATEEFIGPIYCNSAELGNYCTSSGLSVTSNIYWQYNWSGSVNIFYWKNMTTPATYLQLLATNDNDNDGPGYGLWNNYPVVLNTPFVKKYPNVNAIHKILFLDWDANDLFASHDNAMTMFVIMTDNTYLDIPVPDVGFCTYECDIYKGEYIYWNPSTQGSTTVLSTSKSGERIQVSQNLLIEIRDVQANHKIDYKTSSSVISTSDGIYFKNPNSTLKQVTDYKFKNSSGILK